MITLFEHACAVADESSVVDWGAGPGRHSVIAVFPTMRDAMDQQTVERDDVYLTSYNAPLLGRRCLDIVADRGDFLAAFANPQVMDDLTAQREQDRRHFWVTQVLLCRLMPGGRIILV